MAVNQEIERKFLVNEDYHPYVKQSFRITQGYLSKSKTHTVRVRLRGQEGYLTLKGHSNASGLTRCEWEQPIDFETANRLLQLCDPSELIDKTRHIIPEGDLYFEVDEFHGVNQGLTVAEIELTDEAEKFAHPHWLGKEVTGDKRYYNSRLATHPFCKWEELSKG